MKYLQIWPKMLALRDHMSIIKAVTMTTEGPHSGSIMAGFKPEAQVHIVQAQEHCQAYSPSSPWGLYF